ncbi:pilus assembly protein TadG-related protein [Nocardioides nanhaiensis]|uniref:Putative Flp pilus-assembly TadG-like N-terminal domain-containing protein n=1 Tax=Nocardioides nanhaiensis TaxID=1476871 RepID=A0ABP8WV91_9ACTN
MRARPVRPRGVRCDDEGGAVALTVALCVTLLVLVASYCVDLGMQRVVRADMQSVADVAALDMARALGRGVAPGTPAWDAALRASLEANPGNLGGSTTHAAPWVCTTHACAKATVGVVDGNNVFSSTIPAGRQPSAVEVQTTASVDFALQAGSGSATRSAIAALSSSACYKLGSWAARVNSADSVLLNPVLRQLAMQSGAFSNGGTVSALDYKALAGATVNLNQLAAGLGVASVDQLATSTVKLRDLYSQVHALAQPRNSTAITILDSLRATSSTQTTIALSKVISVVSGSGSVLDAQANALDLVGGSISALNGTNAANVYLGATIPSLTSAGLEVRLLQGPKQYCGSPGSSGTIGVRSDVEQLRARVGGQLAPTTLDFAMSPITDVLAGVASAQITAENYATFDFSVAGTSSKLKSVSCGPPAGVTLEVDNGLATVTFSTPLRARVRASLIRTLGLADVVIDVNATVDVTVELGTKGVTSMSLAVPPQSFDTPYPTSSGGVNIKSVTARSGASVNAHVALLSGLLGAGVSLNAGQQSAILSAVLGNGMAALLSPTDSRSLSKTVFDPVLALIGARVAGSDVILDSKPALNCGTPRLAG